MLSEGQFSKYVSKALEMFRTILSTSLCMPRNLHAYVPRYKYVTVFFSKRESWKKINIPNNRILTDVL